jgi:hypothetical protein
MAVQVVLDHVRMAAVLLRVRLRTAKNLRQERGDMAWMVCAHMREDGLQQ